MQRFFNQTLLCSIELGSIKCNLETAKIGILPWDNVHHYRETAQIGFCTSLKSISISGFVDTRDKVNAD